MNAPQVLPFPYMVITMNLIKAMVIAVVAVSCTAAFAQDGSERSNQAAQKMRIAQEARFDGQNSSDASRYVSADEKSRAEQLKKSDG
jgi:hypothetical protein